MSARLGIAGALVAVALATGLAGCGAQQQPVESSPRVTVPTPTGPPLTATAFRTQADAACRVLYDRVGALGDPPTSSATEAQAWYPKVAAAWHAHLDAVDTLVPPADLQATWRRVVDAYRAITQAADDNVALANAGREAIDLINSDPTAAQTLAGLTNVDYLRQLGLGVCAGTGSG